MSRDCPNFETEAFSSGALLVVAKVVTEKGNPRMITLTEIDVTQGFGDGFVVTPSQNAMTNTSSLQHILNTLLTLASQTNGSGGTLIFPSVGSTADPSYQFAGSVTVGHDSTGITRPFSIVIRGDGQQQASAPLLVQTIADHMFVVNTNDGMDDNDSGGVVFQDLMIAYTASSPSAENSAIKVINGSQATRLTRVTILNWPIAVNFSDCYKCSIIDCTAHTQGQVKYSTIGVRIGDDSAKNAGIESYIAGCLLLDDSNLGIGIQIYGAEHLRVMNTRVDGWQQGVTITPVSTTESARWLYLSNVSCHPASQLAGTQAGAALLITTNGSTTNKYVFHAAFVGCEFSAPEPKPGAPTSKYQGAGVVIGPAGGSIDAIDQIRFVDCHVCRWLGPGLEIVGGSEATVTAPTNVEILGGYYSLNGSSPATGLPSAGIFITGGSNGPSGIRIIGAACNNSLFDTENHVFDTPTQQYGIYVNKAAEAIRVHGCDFTGNLTNGAYVDGSSAAPKNLFIKHCDFTGLSSPTHVVTPVTNLQIVDCPGYNDQGTVIATSITLGTAFTIAQLGTVPYYGPGECYVNGAGAPIKINNQSSHLALGSFYLQPRETIEVDTSVSNFLAIGK